MRTYGKPMGTIYETQYFHGQNLIIARVKSFSKSFGVANHYGKPKGKIIFSWSNSFLAWVKSFVHGQNHFSMGKFFLSMGEFICAWAKSF